MVFKGTQKLSETDIPLVSHQFSGELNAGTNYDYTMYYFNFPIQHWEQALPIFADCMRNCTFKEDLLNAEFKTVIQELKMYKDHFTRSLSSQLYSTIFQDHPYHFPIIGYKQDLWNIHQKDLLNFYHKHYVPNNATIVVVGAVDPENVYQKVNQHFGDIASDAHYQQKKNYHNKDLSTYAITLYRDVQKSEYVLAYPIPGASSKTDYSTSILSSVLTDGKSSRLSKKLVHELKLASTISSYSYQTFEHDIFFVHFQPLHEKDVDTIISLIQQGIDDIACNGFKKNELGNASRHIRRDMYSLMENNNSLAYSIGKYYLATGDENLIINYLAQDLDEVGLQAQALASTYLQSSFRSMGIILPTNKQQQLIWQDIQHKSDEEDVQFLSERMRQSEVEQPLYAQQLSVQKMSLHKLPQPHELIYPNGLKIITHPRTGIPKVSLVIKLKADNSYDPEDRQGLYSILCSMMYEGTAKYTGEQLANELESRGIILSISSGFIYMEALSENFEKRIGASV